MLHAMATAWDRAAEGYAAQWLPRYVPYQQDLIRELTLRTGDRVLVTAAGPGAEAVAVARLVGNTGSVRATDTSHTMVRLARERVRAAGFTELVHVDEADALDTSGGPWDAIVCAFGLWQVGDREKTLATWRNALSPLGKVGVLVWGPPDVEGPWIAFRRALARADAALADGMRWTEAEREPMARLFEQAGLELVRHTVVRHTLTFHSAESFVRALEEACIFPDLERRLGDDGYHRVVVSFYDQVGGPDSPLVFQPAATIGIGCAPGAQVELEGRPSRRPPPPSQRP
jgi:ubiquinone/menaquinone biosynthesis C-methylase UbiE